MRKYDTNGNPIWTGTYNGTGNGNDGGQGIAVDPSGDILVTGYEWVTSQNYNIWVRKYDTNGNPIWTQNYNGTDNNFDVGQGIAVDPSGDIAVCGYESVAGQNYNIWLRKYEGGGPGTITNIAYLYYENLIGTQFVSTATVSVVCEGGAENPNIVVTKTVSPSTGVTRGSTLTYTISFTNTGEGAAKGVVVTDQIPAGTGYSVGSAQVILGPSANISYSHDFGATYDTSQTAPVTHIKWSLTSDLAAGATGSVRFEVLVK
ncbi:MAG: hypothetical protein AAB267_10500 [Candidatus Desantisbacteria bacterium]